MISRFVMSSSTFIVIMIIVLSCSVLAHDPSNDLLAAAVIGGSMVFELPGSVGVFRESGSAFYSISVKDSKSVAILFEVSDLSYLGDEQVSLDAVYWVGKDSRNSFSPGNPLVLRRIRGSHTFSFHGQVTIKAVEAQPAGEYRGKITITLFEDRG